jgi:hypothetical protein
VTLPPGVSPGQEIHVQAPDGKINAIVIPPGFGPGSTFTVEFADDASSAPVSSSQNTYIPPVQAEVYNDNRTGNYNNANSINPNFDATPVAQAQAVNNPDDGFASGFGRR